MTAPGGFVAGDVLGAADMNALPGGVQGYASVTANQNTITTVTDLTSLTVTWTAVSSRLYKISFQCNVQNNDTVQSATEYIAIQVTDGSNNQKNEARVTGPEPADGGGNDGVIPLVGIHYETGLSGSTTRKLRMVATTSSADLAASSTAPATLIVEDIGPA